MRTVASPRHHRHPLDIKFRLNRGELVPFMRLTITITITTINAFRRSLCLRFPADKESSLSSILTGARLSYNTTSTFLLERT